MRIVSDECIIGGKTVVKGICAMNVTKISKVSFTGKIIDSHAHVGGHCGEVYRKNDLDVFVKSKLPNDDTVEKMIVSSLDVLHGANGEIEGNKAVLRDFAENGKYALLASCNPRAGSVGNIRKLFSEHPESFAGLKFHPAIQDLRLQDKRYEPYMQFASENGLPCLFHTQVELLDGGKLNLAKTHVADPENIYFLARKYPQTPVFMAHLGAGWREAHDKAADVLISSIRNGDANLYADVSWVDIDDAQTHIVKTIKRLKGIGERDWSFEDQSFRLMFGTDAPLGRFKSENAAKTYADYVERIKAAIRADVDLKPDAEKIIDDLFYNNAEKLYLSRFGGVSGNKKGTSFEGSSEVLNVEKPRNEGGTLASGEVTSEVLKGAENVSSDKNGAKPRKTCGSSPSGSTPKRGKIAAMILGISAVAGAIFIYRKIKADKASR